MKDTQEVDAEGLSLFSGISDWSVNQVVDLFQACKMTDAGKCYLYRVGKRE
jgi:hypothetical protein